MVHKKQTAKRQQGDRYEKQAMDMLTQAGFVIIASNFSVAGVGEIDIIAQTADGKSLVFVEVRSRTLSAFGTAIDSISPAKQARIYRTAERFLQDYPQYANCACRFDVIAFDLSQGQVDTQWLECVF